MIKHIELFVKKNKKKSENLFSFVTLKNKIYTPYGFTSQITRPSATPWR